MTWDNIVRPTTHPDHAVVGWIWVAHDGHDYFCDAYDPTFGYWMTRVDAPAERRADTGGTWRRNVSERAIHRTFHRPRRAKALFLDIDGVLRVEADFRAGTRLPELPRGRIDVLNEVLAATGAQVVVSSTWREDGRTLAMLRDLGIAPIHADWRTPQLPMRNQGRILQAPGRGQEIVAWLDQHPEVTRHAIVDDEPGHFVGRLDQLARLAVTSFQDGLDRSAASRLTEILEARA